MISKRKFCINNNFEFQTFMQLLKKGIIIPLIDPQRGLARRICVQDDLIDILKEGVHYVCCPCCGKKMAAVTHKHYKVCKNFDKNKNIEKNLYSEVFTDNHKQTEELKEKHSKVLKNRFKTPEGEITRNQIGEASKERNSDPEYKRKQKITFKKVQNRPELKRKKSLRAKKMWSDPAYIEKNKKYVEENIKELRLSAANARLNHSKTSKVHLLFKDKMIEYGIKDFNTEYIFGYYSIDEADPLSKVAIEVDGCYWHGCEECGFKGDPRIKNIDKRKETYLKNRGWEIIRVKEHDLKDMDKTMFILENIKGRQDIRKKQNIKNIKESFLKGKLKVESFNREIEEIEWKPIQDILRHNSENKRMMRVYTEKEVVCVTEDHSLFLYGANKEVMPKDLKIGDLIIGKDKYVSKPFRVIAIEDVDKEKYAFDLSIPGNENFFLSSGILAHNTYSISGVSLTIDKFSKYEAMKNNFIQEWDKARDLAKTSIKIIKGLRQPKFGVGISSALGPYSRPGVQSRRNFVSGALG